jgi:hypothetical protein
MLSAISEIVKNGKFHLILLVAGIIFIFLSMFYIQDITKGQISFISPRFFPLCVGIIFLLAALIFSDLDLLQIKLRGVKKIQYGFQVQLKQAKINILFGKLEELYQPNTGELVILPANNLFDDECINDSRSALGSFVAHEFPKEIHKIQSLVTEQSQKTDEASELPYEIGKYLYFDRPLGTQIKMAFVAVTTIDGKLGITCEPENIFSAIQGVHTLMNEKRIDKVMLPLIGCGHGGMLPPISLTCMLLAFAEAIRKPSGSHIKEVSIVIFRKDRKDTPQITSSDIKRLLFFVRKYYRE